MNDLKKEEKNDEFLYGNKARPEHLPSPTYWPFFMAIGFTFLLWGIVTMWAISLAGLLLVVFSLSQWIKILRDEGKRERNQ